MNQEAHVAIVDHSLGNMFSVMSACRHVGLSAELTGDPSRVAQADAVILPGVGAFRDAMSRLRELGMVDAIRAAANDGRIILGVCLGLQLLMSESEEHGHHEGLNLIEGSTVRFPVELKVQHLPIPQIGWNRIRQSSQGGSWEGGILDGIENNSFMYFLHSFYVRPVDDDVVLSSTTYGDVDYCSTLLSGNVMGCQYHPERSGGVGLRIYRNLAKMLGRADKATA